MIQVRNVPDELHKELVRRAEASGLSLTAYIQQVLEREVSVPTREEIIERLRTVERIAPPKRAAEYLREAREERYGPDEW